jgi:hypothetical protein
MKMDAKSFDFSEVVWVATNDDAVLPIGDGVIFVGSKPKPTWMLLECRCVIRETICLPVGNQGVNWDLVFNPDGTFSVTPSILQHKCQCHFFIKNSKIEYC